MPKIILSLDNNKIKEFELNKSETTIGRRSSNDIQIQNLAVSGKHARIVINANDTVLEDLNSTNGTYVNGRLIKKQALDDQDEIIIGKYKLEYLISEAADDRSLSSGSVVGSSTAAEATNSALDLGSARNNSAIIEVKNGAKAGQILPIQKPVTTLGRPGIQIAAIMKKPEGYFFMHIESEEDSTPPQHNQSELGEEAVLLSSGDSLTVAGIKVEFMLS